MLQINRTERLNVEFDIMVASPLNTEMRVHALRCLIQHASTIGGWRSLEVLTLSQILKKYLKKLAQRDT